MSVTGLTYGVYMNLEYQIPDDQCSAQHASSPKHHSGCASPFSSFRELLISLPNVFLGKGRILNKLIYVSRLHCKVVGQSGLQFRYLDQRAFRISSRRISD